MIIDAIQHYEISLFILPLFLLFPPSGSLVSPHFVMTCTPSLTKNGVSKFT